MKGCDQYPDAYKKDHSIYSYYTDTKELITLKAGEDGVTEKWIELLKQMHREEINMLRRGRSKGKGENILLSLDWFVEQNHDKSSVMSDVFGSIEDEYIRRVEYEETTKTLREALKTITDEQKYILFQVHLNKRTRKDIASELGITRQSLSERLGRIEKKLQKKMLNSPCVYMFSAHRHKRTNKAT